MTFSQADFIVQCLFLIKSIFPVRVSKLQKTQMNYCQNIPPCVSGNSFAPEHQPPSVKWPMIDSSLLAELRLLLRYYHIDNVWFSFNSLLLLRL